MALILVAVAGLLGLRLPAGTFAARGAWVGSAAVLLLATVVLASPSARNHAHGEHDDSAAGGHVHGAAGVGESAAGVSAIEDCSDGTYFMLPVGEWATHQLNVCQSDPS